MKVWLKKWFIVLIGLLVLYPSGNFLMAEERLNFPEYPGINLSEGNNLNDRQVIVKLTENRIKFILNSLIEDPESINYGGFVFDRRGYAGTRTSISNGLFLIIGYIYPDFEEYYANPVMLSKIEAHLEFIKKRQREDGSISLAAKSVDGSNEVGFTIPGVVETFIRLGKSNVPGKNKIMEIYEIYLRKATICLWDNFPYTSNHRWTAYCAPLAAINTLFPNPVNTEKINEYLSDGIDIDSDGLYNEELSPNYNHVTNWGLIMLADYLDQPDYLEMVNKNLQTCLYMRQPGEEVETMYSRRQDRGEKNNSWGSYYPYKRIALEKSNGVYARAADYQLSRMANTGRGMVEDSFIPLIYLFDDPFIQNDTLSRLPLPENFTVAFKDFPLWRFRKENVSATIAADPGGHWFDIALGNWKGYVRSNNFMTYHSGKAIIDGIKIFWVGGNESFHPEDIEYLQDGSIRLFYRDPGWEHIAHFRPKGKWGPRHVKGRTAAEVRLWPKDYGSFDVQVDISGWEDIPLNLTFLLREDCAITIPGNEAQNLVSNEKTFTLKGGDYLISDNSGNGIILQNLPESEHMVELKDSRYIEGKAEERSHNLIVGLFSNKKFTFSIVPVHTQQTSPEIYKKQ